MGVEKKHDEPDPKVDPTPLAPGVWVTDATGFASVPPRAQSDVCDVRDENDRNKKAEDAEPRIERYPER